ncbi:hypothetical protein RM572_02460 [Streptomyces sp. DSM 42041]|uniref:CHAD domain-containing protein n=1 Tax=Streptomyces hazeniae TaxID=3075538 RepID=A0ABU2NKW3_9ACTN|nr:hypothetical protein [Streptomyces sp. DSM 42041]MDT0377636.1 hypothetical protein [Streptomyces sp. DSM 42041]
MGPPRPAVPAMSREEADRELSRLYTERETVESTLLALHEHAGRRLLEGADLTGVTARRWAHAETTITLLWTCFDLYTDTLRAARDLRKRHRWPTRDDLTELTGLLHGTLTVPAERPADGASGLSQGGHSGGGDTGGGDAVEELTLPQLVRRMNAWYARALDVVVAAEAVWSALPARIDLLAEELGRVRSLARSVGVRPGEHPSGDGLERITGELAALRAEVLRDPLAFWNADGGSSAPGGGRPDTTRYDAAARAIEDVRRDIEAVLTVRQDAEQRLLRLRDMLSRADRTLAEARTARVEVLAKIAASEVPAVSGPPTALQEQLSRAAEYRRYAQWNRLSPLLESLEEEAEDELDRARASLSAVTAPLAVRAELRGRLDAYRAEVARCGAGQDRLLRERYDAARRILWSAPCDLGAAETAVRRYVDAAREVFVPRQGDGSPAEHRGER